MDVAADAALVIRVERGRNVGAVLAEVEDSSDDGLNGAEFGVAAAAMPDLLAANRVFLVSEHQNSVGCGAKGSFRGGLEVQAGLADVEFDVCESERGREGLCRGDSIFPGATKVIQSNADHVCAGVQERGRVASLLACADEDWNRYWLDSGGCRIGDAVASEHGAEAVVYFTVRAVARVRGPQKGERLAHVAQLGIHRASLDGPSATAALARSDSVGVHHEDLHRVGFGP